MFKAILVFTLATFAASCAGGDGDGSASSDPRCNSICVIEEPSLAGAHDICSEDSAALCRDECNARIELQENLCATCLLEGADFGLGDGDVSLGDVCESGQCTKRGREGSCTYPEGDDQARDDCTRQVYPRREVHCDSDFASVQNCSGICES